MLAFFIVTLGDGCDQTENLFAGKSVVFHLFHSSVHGTKVAIIKAQHHSLASSDHVLLFYIQDEELRAKSVDTRKNIRI